MSDAARTYLGYTGSGLAGGTASASGREMPTPKRETLAETLIAARDAQGQGHELANAIMAKLGIQSVELDAKAVPSPPGVLGLALDLRSSAMVLRDLLERIDQALG